MENVEVAASLKETEPETVPFLSCKIEDGSEIRSIHVYSEAAELEIHMEGVEGISARGQIGFNSTANPANAPWDL